jgi:hypothetical protein
MLKQALGDNSSGQTQTYSFKNGQTSADDDDHSGWASNSITQENVTKVVDLILQDH